MMKVLIWSVVLHGGEIAQRVMQVSQTETRKIKKYLWWRMRIQHCWQCYSKERWTGWVICCQDSLLENVTEGMK